MRSFLLAATLSAAESLAVDVTHKSKKPAVQALMESATTMLKTGATPAVVDFTQTTLDEVSATVLPAILDESVNDQRFIYSLHSRFQVVLDNLAQKNREVYQLNYEEQTLSQRHKECRQEESGTCTAKRECEKELYSRWAHWVAEEEDLQEIHNRIDGHFCPPDANGTLHSFRVASVPMMHQYMEQKRVAEEAEAAYDEKLPDCIVAHHGLDHQSAACNTLQTDLEEKACAHGAKIRDALGEYYGDYAQAASSYNCAQEEVMQLENDRKREWTTLKVVNCLLERIQAQNGVPCDSADGVTEEVAHCEEKHSNNPCNPLEDGNATLCLDYPPVLAHPEPCTARDQVIGECLPGVQPLPCSNQWNDQEYGSLPAVPLPPFREDNPGCNAYPECAGYCSEMPTPSPQSIDSCPGYTIDGCASDGEEGEHPLTFVRNADGVADVRCCSLDGTTCQSQHFEGGVSYTTEEGRTDEGCFFQVTYQEAMSVCHSAGMRMCTADEVETCCHSGCWHNHNAVWVDVAGTSGQVD